jgi:predicted Zn finger-like uncharacterized protein
MVEIGSMHIVCPHCTTSYAINLAALGAEGRTVRCSRCKEVWLARPQDAIEAVAPEPAMAEAGQRASQGGPNADAATEWEALAREEASAETPVVDSPSIAGDWSTAANDEEDNGWQSMARHDAQGLRFGRSRLPGFLGRLRPDLQTACAGMGALVLALIIWRADVVRLLPQTASFYKMVGLDVNLRGVSFKDVKVTTETMDGKPVLVIEGVIVGETKKPVELPRLRFSVRDAQGAEIYAWNTVLDQPVLKPGEHAWFKSRLASPPPEGRNIDIRFFNRRDVAGGSV